MTYKYFFEIVLVLLASSTIFSLELKLVPFQQRRMNTRSLKPWNNLQKLRIQQCLPHRNDFRLPLKSMNPHQYPKAQVLAVIHETLQQIFSLFIENISLGGGEKNDLEKFIIELHQELQYLEGFMELEAKQESGAFGSEILRLQIKTYFLRIRNYLEAQDYSSCAWIIVQVEINRCLFFVFRLTEMLNKKS